MGFRENVAPAPAERIKGIKSEADVQVFVVLGRGFLLTSKSAQR
jgi:hypothetical protein